MKRLYLWVILFVVRGVASLVTLHAAPPPSDLPVLFRPVDLSLAATAGAPPVLAARIQPIKIDQALLEESVTRASRLRGYFGNNDVILVPGRVTARSNGQTWIGSVDGYPLSSAIFTAVNGVLTGTLNFDGRKYSIQPATLGYLLVEHDPNGVVPFFDDTVPSDLLAASPSAGVEEETAETGSRIDLLVLYTQEFSNRYGSAVDSMIQHFVDVANAAYLRSGIGTQLNLVHASLLAESQVAEGVGLAQALPQLASNPTAATLRNTYKADLVSLLRVYQDSGGCGIAYSMTNVSSSFESAAFSIVEVRTAAEANPNYCPETGLAHELGHNMGCAHDRDHAATRGAYSYSYGYDIAGVFGTIMSYDQPRIHYFSTPLVSYSGYPIGKPEGEPDSADNSRTINQTRLVVANFRISTAPVIANLAPYEPAGWSRKVVVSSEPGTRWDSILFANSNLLVDLAIVNNGEQTIPAGFWVKLSIDDGFVAEWQVQEQLAPGGWYQLSDYSIGPLSVGDHSLLLQIDSQANVNEIDELDNQFTRRIVVQDPGCDRCPISLRRRSEPRRPTSRR